ncbi:hypothetical protein [Diaphorobacter caeni]|uniref:hypothetical protein n=1 Tax=Diaphorobacter caeni TaxID=2784387 RepID=UPI00188EA9BC|nr:hypothetical protein [Diaphorobacter caeni]MBF5007623.1 hypothetical protein [Diaphorobacter caeni]
MEQVKIGALRVWHIPQIPGKPFHVAVDTPREAKKLLSVLADYDLFQLEHNIKPDYCNVGGLEVYEQDDGEGAPGWCEWFDEETGYDIGEWEPEE